MAQLGLRWPSARAERMLSRVSADRPGIAASTSARRRMLIGVWR